MVATLTSTDIENDRCPKCGALISCIAAPRTLDDKERASISDQGYDAGRADVLRNVNELLKPQGFFLMEHIDESLTLERR
jgi:hypothetical protein